MNKLRYNVSFWLGALFFFYGRRFQRPVDRSVQEIGFDLFVWAGNDLRVSRSLDTKL